MKAVRDQRADRALRGSAIKPLTRVSRSSGVSDWGANNIARMRSELVGAMCWTMNMAAGKSVGSCATSWSTRDYENAAPTMMRLMRTQGEPCEG